MRPRCSIAVVIIAAALLAGCSKQAEKSSESSKKSRATPITTIKSVSGAVIVTQESIGLVESTAAPYVSAEAAGTVKKIFADVGQPVKLGQRLLKLDDQNLSIGKQAAEADVNRLTILVNNQEKTVDRYSKLAKENFVNRAMVDDVQAQQEALNEQLASAKARLARVNSDLAKTTITSPATGKVERRLVDEGDFVNIGKPVFRIATDEYLRIVLPFPETAASSLAVGQHVKLSSPIAPGKTVDGKVTEIRPMITPGARAVELILNVPNPGGWKPGGTVKGILTLEERQDAVMIPETCVVLRPAGGVVYVIDKDTARQQLVTTGARKEGMVEIISGVTEGQTLALDGAAYLTDGATVSIQEVK